MNYSHQSHTHCYEASAISPDGVAPCGLKGKHCCLCDILTPPPNNEGWAEKELELLHTENLLMPKIYSFTDVKALISQAEQRAFIKGVSAGEVKVLQELVGRLAYHSDTVTKAELASLLQQALTKTPKQ